MQRSTNHHHISGGVHVKLDVTRLGDRGVELFYSWVEIWLLRNCKAGWYMEKFEFTGEGECASKTVLQVTFDDVREALYFKLSPEYLRGQTPHSRFLTAA